MTRRLVFVAWAVLMTAAGLGAEPWADRASPVPLTATARQSDASRGVISTTPVERLVAGTWTDPSGVRVSVRLAKAGVGEARLWEIRWEPGADWGSGTWVAYRDGLGRVREVRVLILEATDGQDHRIAQPGTWLRVVPQSSQTSRVDLFVAGRLVTGGWSLPTNLTELLVSDDSWLWEQTATDLDWEAWVPERRWEDERVEALRNRVRKELSTIPVASLNLWWPDPASGPRGTRADGAPWGRWSTLLDPQGTATRGLGPWGVSLWVTDGVLRGWKAPYVAWKDLTVERSTRVGVSPAWTGSDPMSEPQFAYDWIRNLGLAVHRALYPARPHDATSADVQAVPFLTPVAGAGYEVDEAAALWHLLAVTQPGRIYLASLSIQQAGLKGAPGAVAFGPPAVVFPWIGEDDRLRVSVFAGPRELTWTEWAQQLPSRQQGGLRPDHVALTALPVPAETDLPLLPLR